MSKQYRLPKEFAEKWIAALRSGEYKQGVEFLKNRDDKYCCLGVGCDLAGLDDNCMLGASFPSDAVEGIEDTAMPAELLEDGNSTFNMNESLENQGSLVAKLVYLNDVQKKTFPEIASWIESNCELY